jgi:hypothetical protein
MRSIACCLIVAGQTFGVAANASSLELTITGSWNAADYDVSSTGPKAGALGIPEEDDDLVFGTPPSAGSTTFTLLVNTDDAVSFPAGYGGITHDWYGYSDVTFVGTHGFGSATWTTDGIVTALVGVDGLKRALWTDADISVADPTRLSFRMFGVWDGMTADLFVGSRTSTTIGPGFLMAEYYGGEMIHSATYSAVAHVLPTGNTPPGHDVVVRPTDPATGEATVTLTFSNVIEGGETSLTMEPTGTPPPSGLRLGNPPRYYVIETSAVYSGPISICILYAGVSHGNENHLRIFHDRSGHWEDITTSLDTRNDVICGETSSFSAFALLEPPSSNSMELPSEVVLAGCGRTRVPVTLTNDCAVDSLSFGILHDPSFLEAVDFEASPVWAGSMPRFLFANSSPEASLCGQGKAGIVVAMVGLPEDPQARTIPPGQDRVIGTIEYARKRVLGSAESSLEFCDCLIPNPGSPPTACKVSSQGAPVEIWTSGSVVRAATQEETSPCFVRGRCNGDSEMDISDPVFLLSFLFSGGPQPPCKDACDMQDDGTLDISDGIGMLGFLFMGSHPPGSPFPEAGQDPTEDALDCDRHDIP